MIEEGTFTFEVLSDILETSVVLNIKTKTKRVANGADMVTSEEAKNRLIIDTQPKEKFTLEATAKCSSSDKDINLRYYINKKVWIQSMHWICDTCKRCFKKSEFEC